MVKPACVLNLVTGFQSYLAWSRDVSGFTAFHAALEQFDIHSLAVSRFCLTLHEGVDSTFHLLVPYGRALGRDFQVNHRRLPHDFHHL